MFNSTNEYTIVDRDLNMPECVKLVIPYSGHTKRRFRLQSTNEITQSEWSISKNMNHVSIDQEGLLTIGAEASPQKFEIIVKVEGAGEKRLQVELNKVQGKDFPPNPLQKEGWKLYVHDEFDQPFLNRNIWTDQYLRNWSDDHRSRTKYFIENGAIHVGADIDSDKWSPYDNAENSSITSFEKTYLHRFGENKNEYSRIIPKFDGFATKYGYFEIRAKLPNTGDGSHVAWWMIGVQDDQNIFAQITDPTVQDKRTSNETGEVDIIEIGLDELTSWRPVIHPNESTSLEYLYVPETELLFDPGNEYHIYGFEWDENGTKFYVDNELVQSTDRTFDYRMMTFLGLYPQGGMGEANRIFPKEFIIDYFRVYKKDEPNKANDIRIEKEYLPYCVRKPNQSEQFTLQMKATVLNPFDEPLVNTPVIWQFSDSITGGKTKQVKGVQIDEMTGVMTFTDDVEYDTDLFITVKVKENPHVRKVFHMKVSDQESKPLLVKITPKLEKVCVQISDPIHFNGKVFDQYGAEIVDEEIEWAIATGTTLKDINVVDGVNIDEDGCLTITDQAKTDQYVFVIAKTSTQAKAQDKYSLDNTIYAHQLIYVSK